jgi:hypothetical protein
MKLNLSTWQRFYCANIVGAIGGANASTFRKAAKLLDVLELTDDDKKQVGYVDETAALECDLSALKSRVGLEVESAWISGDEGVLTQRPGDVFIAARVPTGQTSWEDKAHRWKIEVKDGNLATMLKEQTAAFSWPQGLLASRETRAQILDLLDQLGIDGE